MSDWQSSRNLPDSHLYLFQNEVETDVEFLVGNENTKTVRAHRIILACRSPVFYAMFYGKMREQEKVILLPDIKPASMVVFLTYVYTDTAALLQSNVVDVLNAATKYCVDNLVDLCTEFMASNIDQNNIATAFETSLKFGIKKLTNACAQFVVRNPNLDTLKNGSLNSLTQTSLKKFVSSDYLAVNELDLFKFATCHWAKDECSRQQLAYACSNIRKVLGKVLYKIRFPLISSSNLKVNVDGQYYDLLTAREIDDISKSTNEPGRLSNLFPNNTRLNIFDAMGLATVFTTGFGTCICELQSAHNVSLTLKSIILKVSKYSFDDTHLRVTLKSESSRQFGSKSSCKHYNVEIDSNTSGKNKYVNIILPGNGFAFSTKTSVHVEKSIVTSEHKEDSLGFLGKTQKQSSLLVSHFLDRAGDYSELVSTYAVAKERWKEFALPDIVEIKCEKGKYLSWECIDVLRGFAVTGSYTATN